MKKEEQEKLIARVLDQEKTIAVLTDKIKFLHVLIDSLSRELENVRKNNMI